MKTLVLFSLIIFSLQTSGQSCDTIQERVVNCTDSNGLKQGAWEVWNDRLRQQEDYGPVPGFCQTAPLIKARTTIKNKGEYLDDKKIGKWTYFEDGGDLYAVSRIEIYESDGSVEVKTPFNLTTAFYNHDSTLVNSTVLETGEDTVHISCVNRACLATFKRHEFIRFTLDNLAFEQHRIQSGIYHREIEKLKSD